jgi:hypothetical protein
MERLIDTLRAIVGALNANGLGTGDSIPVALARMQERMEHLEKTMGNMQKILIGMAISVLTLVVKMLIEGVFLK